MKRGDFLLMDSNYSFSCIIVDKRPDGGSKLEPKHVVMNKLIKSIVLCV